MSNYVARNNTKVLKEEKLMMNLERITGFTTTSTLTSENGYFMLAYCLRNGTKISHWFSQQGSLDFIDGVLLALKETIEYNKIELGFDTTLYTILFTINSDRTKATQVIKEIAIDDQDREGINYENMLTLADNLPPFIVDSFIV